MKVTAAALGLLVVALGTLLLLRRLPKNALGAAPNIGAPAAQTPSTTGPTASAGNVNTPELAVPLSDADQQRHKYDRQRIPFFAWIRDHLTPPIQRAGVTESLDTLDLLVNNLDNASLSALVSGGLGTQAYQYGFMRIRFYVGNPPGAIHPTTCVAEATRGDAGNWSIFRK